MELLSSEAAQTRDQARKIELIIKFLQIMDDFSVLRKTRLEAVDKLVNEINDKRISSIWNKYRKTAAKIAYFPLRIPRVRRLISVKELLRMTFSLALVFTMFILGYIIHTASTSNPEDTQSIRNLLLLLLVGVALSTSAIAGTYAVDYMIRRTVVEWEEKERGLLNRYQIKMKEGAQETINVLRRIISETDVRQDVDYIVELWHSDYKNIELVGSRKGKVLIFRTKYNIFIYRIAPR